MTTIEDLKQELLERGRAVGFPGITLFNKVTGYSGEGGWNAFLRNTPTRYELDALAVWLQPLEEAQAQREAREAEAAVREEERNRPMSADEIREQQEMLREAEQRAKYRRSSEGRLEAVEGLLTEIRDLLAKRAG